MVVTGRNWAVIALAAGCFGAGCKPSLEGRPSLVDSVRVLSIRSTPAEAKPDGKTEVQYDALYVGPDGIPDPKSLEWALCDARKPIALTSPVALECLTPADKALDQVNRGIAVSGLLPTDACSVFGPTPPQPEPGQPAARPADPDTTGGYYQPIRVLFSADDVSKYSVGVTRLACGLGGATLEQGLDYANRYRPNENPAVDSLVLVRASGKEETFSTGLDATPLTVTPGERVTLRVAWAKCPVTSVCGDGICGANEATSCAPSNKACVLCPADCPAACTSSTTPCVKAHGCTGSEPYVELDPAQRAIVDRRESILVSWFSPDGDLDHDRTGSTEAQADITASDNVWTAPGTKGDVPVWVVLRDDRGGTGWTEVHVDVEP